MVKTIVSFDQPAEDVPAVEDSEESVAESAEEEGTVEDADTKDIFGLVADFADMNQS